MLDGVLDLLSAILVMGIVFAIAFGFILPLNNAEFMQFDSKYEDKGAMSNVIDYGDSAEFEKVTKRLYTYEELMLLLSVQDSKMAEPKSINIRNLVTTVDLSYSGYGDNRAYDGEDYGELNLNLIYAVPAPEGTDPNVISNALYGMTVDDLRANLNKDEAYQALIRYAENHYAVEGDAERAAVIGYPTDKDNVGVLPISDSFALSAKNVVQELNGSEYPNLNRSKVYSESKDTRLSLESNITVPSTTDYDSKRIYHIQHHFALPAENKFLAHSDMSDFKRIDDEKAAYYVEIEGVFPRKNTNTEIDTYAEYNNYLKLLREEMVENNVIKEVLD